VTAGAPLVVDSVELPCIGATSLEGSSTALSIVRHILPPPMYCPAARRQTHKQLDPWLERAPFTLPPQFNLLLDSLWRDGERLTACDQLLRACAVGAYRPQVYAPQTVSSLHLPTR
jgi:hypothetical protein